MLAQVKADLRRIGRILLVVLAPIALYLGLRGLPSTRPPLAVWAELTGERSDRRYRPRTAIFDGARRHLDLAAARGEVLTFVVRVRTERPLPAAEVRIGDLRGREGVRSGAVFRIWRAENGTLAPAAPRDLPAGGAAAWHVEVAVPRDGAPGRYAAPLAVESEGSVVERLLLRLRVFPVALGPAPLAAYARGAELPPDARAALAAHGVVAVAAMPAGRGEVLGDEPRRDLWRAYRQGAAWVEVGDAGALLAARPGALAPTFRLWEVRRALADLAALALLRARGEGLAERVLARVAAAPPPDPAGWEQVRRELTGLLNAPGGR
jgi:hypothetical protein